MGDRIAIIDLGTNTFHLLVAENNGGHPVILHREKQPVKIGMGGINEGRITKEAAERAMACLHNFKKTMDAWKTVQSLAFGTSALRSASNGKEIIDQIKKETHIEIILISGSQEAEYIYYGVRSALDLGPEPTLIMDIGGGSVEFIIGNESRIIWKQSFDIGAQRMLERYQKHDPILPGEIEQLELHFANTLTPLLQAMEIHKPVVLAGSSGTFDTLSEIHCIRQNIEIEENQRETPLSLDSFHNIHKELLVKNRAERLRIPGMIELRVDMIVVASCLIAYVLKSFPIKTIRVSSYSLKEGVLSTLFDVTKTRP